MMYRKVVRGMAAGAAGTVALDIATYADMAIRGRPSSSVPAQLAGKLTEALHVDLEGIETGQQGDQIAEQRRSGLGALFGYATGLGIGAAYGLVRPQFKRVSLPVAGVAVGLAAMVASDVPAVSTGVTNPRTWGTSGWLADLIPHLIYGLVTVATFEAYSQRKRYRLPSWATLPTQADISRAWKQLRQVQVVR
jgi:hypothetical protein